MNAVYALPKAFRIGFKKFDRMQFFVYDNSAIGVNILDSKDNVTCITKPVFMNKPMNTIVINFDTQAQIKILGKLEQANLIHSTGKVIFEESEIHVIFEINQGFLNEITVAKEVVYA